MPWDLSSSPSMVKGDCDEKQAAAPIGLHFRNRQNSENVKIAANSNVFH
jgi:hypothetical protein